MALVHLIPELVLAVLGAVLLLAESFSDGRPAVRKIMTGIAVAGALVAGISAIAGGVGKGAYLSGFVLKDGMSIYARALFCGILALVALLMHDYSNVKKVKAGEMLTILAFATIGLAQMTGSGDMLGIYLGLELVSISSYLLAGMLKDSERSIEAALKYFLMGAFASAVMLFGLSLVYGVTGQTNLSAIARVAVDIDQYKSVFIAGSVLIIAGFLFKVSAVPFHMWAPDTYEGAPTPITAFLSVGPKAAAFLALLRVLTVALPSLREFWLPLLGVVSVATMFLGNLSALHQKDLKRLLAYSSIAQAGYMLAAFASAPDMALKSVLMYVTVYALMNLGAFGVVVAIEVYQGTTTISGLSGLWRKAPWLSGLMTIFVISLIGIPPTGGMFAKLLVLGGLVVKERFWLATAVIVNTVISVPYYYGIVKAMYLKDDSSATPVYGKVPVAIALVVAIAALSIVVLGVYPEPAIKLAGVSSIAVPR